MSLIRLNRTDFKYIVQMQTRWADMDAYGHVNNMAFYGFIDSCLTGFLITECGHNKDTAPSIGLVVESGCQYFKPVAFPSIINSGLRVSHLGKSSVRYEVGLFSGEDDEPSAQGFFVHVFVDRMTMRPSSIPENIRDGLRSISINDR
jgi:acyl-CoA thioester hydrolase